MITAYLKVTNFCNVGCSHCYLTESVRADRGRMSEDTLVQVAKLLRSFADARGGDPVRVIWHGGEPLVVPPQWYREAGRILDSVLPGHEESIQTSLVPYTSDYATLIHDRFHGAVGSSVDFTTRKLRGSNEAYLELWLQKVDHARADGVMVYPGFVPSRGELTRARWVMDFFRSNGFRSATLERYNSFVGMDSMRPTNAEHSQFLRELLDCVTEDLLDGREAVYVGVLAAAIRGILYQVPGDRWGGRCTADFVVVEPDGSINNCPDKTSHEKPQSRAADGYIGLHGSLARRMSIRSQAAGHRNEFCETCSYHGWCGGGCPITPQRGVGHETECSGYRSFLDHARHLLTQTSSRSVLERYAAPPNSLERRQYG